MPAQPAAVHRFGRIEVRPAERTLLIDGRAAALGARAFDLLLALIEHRDRVVPKHELLDLVWPHLVVEENNLQVQVSTLRRLLGPKAIATVPGRGYRFTLAGDEPAPRTLPAPLPVPATVIGRDDDLAALLDLLGRHRLVSLVGPGGIGKTTLARCAAHARAPAHADGCAWVELAALADGRLIAGSVAQALDLPLAAGVDTEAALVTALAPLQLLLVLDNAEHLFDALVPLVDVLLAGAPGVHLLVTSQGPLRARGEQVLRLQALAVPAAGTPAADAARHGAVALFVERARALDRRFALDDDNVGHVIEICRRLDGLPLALELAAARVPLLGARGVAERLDDRFRLLAAGSRSAPTRQQTLQAALDWSCALLSPTERQVYAGLGVFAGGCTLELARAVLVGDGLDEWAFIDALATLADHSLVQVAGGDTPRYALGETARAYALQGHDVRETARRHTAALRRHFDAAPDDWLHLADADWLARYEPELDNLRAALAEAQGRGDGETVVALVGAAAPLWHHLALYDEARHWHTLSEPLVDDSVPAPLAARWWRAAQWAWAHTDPPRARAAAAQSLRLYRALGDAHGLYAGLTGRSGMRDEPPGDARAALAEALSLERPDWPPRERAWGRRAVADVARAQGRLHDSRLARQDELHLREAAGDERGRLRALSQLADVHLALGEPAEAARLAETLVEALRGSRSRAARVAALQLLGRARQAAGQAGAADAARREAEALAVTPGASPRRPVAD